MLGVRPAWSITTKPTPRALCGAHQGALNQRERVREIVETISGRELAADWWPSHRWTSAVAWTALPSPASTTRTSTGGGRRPYRLLRLHRRRRQVAVAAELTREVVLARRHLRSLWQGPWHHGWITTPARNVPPVWLRAT